VPLVALASLLERVAVVAVAFEAVNENAIDSALLMGVLAALFLGRSVLRSLLRVEVQTRLIGALSEALLTDHVDIGEKGWDEAEIELFEGLHGCEALVGDQLPSFLGDIPACACMVAIALDVMPARLVLEGCGVMTVGAMAVLASRSLSSRREDRAWEAFTGVLDELSAVIRGRVELVASGTGEAVLSSLRAKASHWRSVSTRASASSFLAGRAPAVAVAVAAGLVLVLDERMRGTAMHGVLGRAALLASMSPAFAGVARASLEIARSGARVRSVTSILEHGGPSRAGDARPLPDLPAKVTLDHVGFTYVAGQPAVLDDLVAAIAPGEVLAVTGANGSGKSTLFALLLGLATPSHGTVSVAGVDLKSLDLRAWRQRIGYLAQRPFLPDRSTVRAAMRLLAPDAGDDALELALRRVEVWPVLCARSRTPPLDVRVGSLSAGEKQRLALARVLARDARVLLLDEPDSNLDADGLDLLATLLRELAPGRSIAVAAHSPRLIAVADRVLRLDRGAPASFESSRSPVGVLPSEKAS
jgi:ABC-type multidrug transport system fused ATPase/permease subunit